MSAATVTETERDRGSTRASWSRVAVIGGGFMGSGIAQSTAAAGIDVVVHEADDRRRGAIVDGIVGELGRSGRLGPDEVEAIASRISVVPTVAEIGDVQLVLEAVPEDLGIKLDVMREVEATVAPDTVISSNTSSIPIAELAGSLARPKRMVGLHFFAPVPAMKLVEVVAALDSSPEAVALAHDFCRRIGKRSIETKDRSGFVVNLLLVPYLMAAVRMYEEGFATPEDIDLGMKLGCGHPMGPLELSDFIGLDVLYNVCDSLYEEFKRDEYAPPPVLKRMVASGRLGRKSGRGFFLYEAGERS